MTFHLSSVQPRKGIKRGHHGITTYEKKDDDDDCSFSTYEHYSVYVQWNNKHFMGYLSPTLGFSSAGAATLGLMFVA